MGHILPGPTQSPQPRQVSLAAIAIFFHVSLLIGVVGSCSIDFIGVAVAAGSATGLLTPRLAAGSKAGSHHALQDKACVFFRCVLRCMSCREMLLPAPVTEEATLEPLHQEILDWLQARACFCNLRRSSLRTHGLQHWLFTLCLHQALHFRSWWQICVTELRCICTLIFSSSSSSHRACPPLFATFLFAFFVDTNLYPTFL